MLLTNDACYLYYSLASNDISHSCIHILHILSIYKACSTYPKSILHSRSMVHVLHAFDLWCVLPIISNGMMHAFEDCLLRGARDRSLVYSFTCYRRYLSTRISAKYHMFSICTTCFYRYHMFYMRSVHNLSVYNLYCLL